MRMLYLAAACVALAACSSTNTPVNTPATVAAPGEPTPLLPSTFGLVDDKAMYAAEAAYNVAAQAYITADTTGALSGETKVKAKVILVQMAGYLRKARAAYALHNLLDFNDAAGQLASLKAAALALLPALN